VSNLEFTPSRPLTLGVELELQLLDESTCDLTPVASDLLSALTQHPHPGEVKLEITQSMIEASTGVHASHASLLTELRAIRDALVAASDELNIRIAGGGAHPLQHWIDRRISDRPRFHHVSALYGYLAQQFTVFGQHIHVGCGTGDDALYLLHSMAHYVPHLIALSASSPYYQGVDTSFDSSRLNSVLAFPLSGRAPFLVEWSDFSSYFARMRKSGIVRTIKDFYWDIRPHPDYGTVEIRVCDTPLTVEHAAGLATYVQSLAGWLLAERPHTLSEDVYLSYSFNRFQACRFGMEGEVVNVLEETRRSIRDDVLDTVAILTDRAAHSDERRVLGAIAAVARAGNDARWMRERYGRTKSFPRLMEKLAGRFRGA